MSPVAAPGGNAPTVAGRIRSIVATPPASGDIPWWAKSIGILAILAVALGVFSVIAVRTVTRAISSSRGSAMSMMSFGLFGGRRSSGGSSLFGDLVKSAMDGFVEYQIGQRERVVQHALLLVVTQGGVVPCRYPTAPSALPLAAGDLVELSGRLYPDNTARVWRSRNLSTGVSHRARIVAPWAPFAAFASLCMYLYVVLAVLASGN
jgi:hypothetical protein